ncbi:MAG: SIS domain-containing protein [Saprospiraceae bacterium]|nr:SIS domain-containing protein [Saprospiraceae bacterium]
MEHQIRQAIADSLLIRQQILDSEDWLTLIQQVAHVWVVAFKAGHRLWFCGNGGSAADAQHLAAELSGRYYLDREPLPAEALHVNTSYLTAVANDYHFDEVYARLLRGAAREGDVLVALSTSGHSPNILKALAEARRMKMITVGFSGQSGGKMGPLCDFLLRVPSSDTPRIQETHMLLGHILCEITEQRIFRPA